MLRKTYYRETDRRRMPQPVVYRVGDSRLDITSRWEMARTLALAAVVVAGSAVVAWLLFELAMRWGLPAWFWRLVG